MKSLTDLKGKASDFKGRVVGIEPSAGEMGLLKDKILPGYGLDKEYKVVDGSTPSMLAELKRAYAKKEPIVVPLWSPHWAYNQFELTKLKDPKNLWGQGRRHPHAVPQASPRTTPEVGKWLKDFKMSEDQLTSLEAQIQKSGSGKEQEAVRTWLKANPDVADKWTPVKKSAPAKGANGKDERDRAVEMAWFPLGGGHRRHVPVEGRPGGARLQDQPQAVRGRSDVHRDVARPDRRAVRRLAPPSPRRTTGPRTAPS